MMLREPRFPQNSQEHGVERGIDINTVKERLLLGLDKESGLEKGVKAICKITTAELDELDIMVEEDGTLKHLVIKVDKTKSGESTKTLINGSLKGTCNKEIVGDEFLRGYVKKYFASACLIKEYMGGTTLGSE